MSILNAKLDELRILESNLSELQKQLDQQKEQFEYTMLWEPSLMSIKFYLFLTDN